MRMRPSHEHGPECPLCGHRMRPVRGTNTGGTEWTCPRCLHTERTPWSPDGGVYAYERLTRESED